MKVETEGVYFLFDGEHQCIIGLLYHQDYSELATLEDLKSHIIENMAFNKSLDDDPIFRNRKELRAKVWTLKSYSDKRRNTDLKQFDYCPTCGKKIDWKKIKDDEQ